MASYMALHMASSAINTKHRAVLACSVKETSFDRGKKSTKETYRRRSHDQHAELIRYLTDYHEFDVLLNNMDEISKMFDEFYNIMYYILEKFYPLKTVTRSNNDPPFVTPEIKALLRRKNRLMHKGRIEEADGVSRLVGKLISKTNSKLMKAEIRGSKELWDMVNKLTGVPKKHWPGSCQYKR